MTARKDAVTRRAAPPGWHRLQDAARLLGIGPSTMTKWVTSGFVRVGYPYYTQCPLVSQGEVERVRAAMEELP